MFIDAQNFEFTKTLESNWQAIRDELDALAADEFLPSYDKHLYEKKRWKAFTLYAFGRQVRANCQRCPKTTQLLAAIPGVHSGGFSRLEPDAHIRPHTGFDRGVYRCHMGLRVPEGGVLRVEDETKSWQEGECLVFDDSLEHEAWNRGGEARVVLLVDFWKDPTRHSLKQTFFNWVAWTKYRVGMSLQRWLS